MQDTKKQDITDFNFYKTLYWQSCISFTTKLKGMYLLFHNKSSKVHIFQLVVLFKTTLILYRLNLIFFPMRYVYAKIFIAVWSAK